ncbi:uncharacterized protein LOC132280420 [Cornus florida]|uniref:uncharacterized protein LOC132280420 n=1 Tax=Cornus florida TaxID=4283 RepID=UPI0028978918|nr:uncharacterized protein LOC132280420 [Cornus florida]
MRSRGHKQSKLKQYIGAPTRFLSKARDFYVESMVSLDGKVGYGNVVGCSAPQMPNLPNSLLRKRNDDDDIRELFRTVSMSKVELDSHRQPGRRQPVVGPNGIGRSYSVGLGKIGTIDEDKPCDFGEEEFIMKSDFMFARSRSYAVTKKNVGYY